MNFDQRYNFGALSVSITHCHDEFTRFPESRVEVEIDGYLTPEELQALMSFLEELGQGGVRESLREQEQRRAANDALNSRAVEDSLKRAAETRRRAEAQAAEARRQAEEAKRKAEAARRAAQQDPGPRRAHTTSSGYIYGSAGWAPFSNPFAGVNRDPNTHSSSNSPLDVDVDELLRQFAEFFDRNARFRYQSQPPKAQSAKRPWREVLGNPKTKAEAKAAYKKLALEYHPDRPGGNQARFIEATEAFNQSQLDLK